MTRLLTVAFLLLVGFAQHKTVAQEPPEGKQSLIFMQLSVFFDVTATHKTDVFLLHFSTSEVNQITGETFRSQKFFRVQFFSDKNSFLNEEKS